MTTGPKVEEQSRRVLIADDDATMRGILSELLVDLGYEVRSCADGFKALGELRQWPAELLLTDMHMPNMDGLALMAKARELLPELDCVVMTAYGSVELAVDAMKQGALDFLTKPVSFDVVELVVARAFERRALRRQVDELQAQLGAVRTANRLIGTSAAVAEVKELVEKIAPSRATVLIAGESGTGKEVIARMLHEQSPRAKGPYVRVHCAALAESLLESELFGHEKGAFTGAVGRRTGRFEEAHGGTLFLDEIGEISPSTQVKLLRFLQQREFERVGGNQTVNVDVRVIAATNRDLKREAEAGRFRQDLFFRLNVIPIHVPPLRNRRPDIPLLAHHFAARFAAENAKRIEAIAPEALDALVGWSWPGNVRELENVLERAVILSSGGRIELRHLPAELTEASALTDGPVGARGALAIPGATLAEVERYLILKTFEAVGGSTARTADVLGISVRKVRYKLKEYAADGDVGAPDR